MAASIVKPPQRYNRFFFTNGPASGTLRSMRVLLVTLHSKYIHNSLALPYLAAYSADLAEFEIFEGTVHEPRENLLAEIHARKGDLVAFSVYLWNRRETLELIDALHLVDPDLPIAVGGPEVSFEGEAFFLNHPGIAAVIHGEGELPFRTLVEQVQAGAGLSPAAGLSVRNEGRYRPATASRGLVESLDEIPSPFQSGIVDLSRGFVYFETSRGCPYTCAFCMSALDPTVRSFSLERILADLAFLLNAGVRKIKLVDRTFNYHPERARQIFAWLLARGGDAHLHFEIGAHLLDEATIVLLEQVPEGRFQFEIGVQSTLPDVLAGVGRNVPVDRVLENVEKLLSRTKVDTHLDLIFGLPEEGFEDFLDSIDWVLSLGCDHLQLEPLKVLPGSILRNDAEALGIVYDPNPPYTVLKTRLLSYDEIERLRRLSRMLDLLYNNGKFAGFVRGLGKAHGSIARGLLDLADYWQGEGRFRFPLGLRQIAEHLYGYVRHLENSGALRDRLAYDYALAERVLPKDIPPFFRRGLTSAEAEVVATLVAEELRHRRGQGVKVQFYADRLAVCGESKIILFLYLTTPGRGMEVQTRVVVE